MFDLSIIFAPSSIDLSDEGAAAASAVLPLGSVGVPAVSYAGSTDVDTTSEAVSVLAVYPCEKGQSCYLCQRTDGSWLWLDGEGVYSPGCSSSWFQLSLAA